MKKSMTILCLLISASAFCQVPQNKQKSDTAQPVKPPAPLELKDTLTFSFPKELAETFNAVLTNQDYSHKKYLELLVLWERQIPGLYKKTNKKQ